MTQVSQSLNNPSAGGFKISPLRGLEFNDYKVLTRYQEYLSNEYCIACTYFNSTKGHFGLCKDLPKRKPFDGTKKGSACALWRLKTIYVQNGIEQKLPDVPNLIHVRAIVRPKDIMRQFRKTRTKISRGICINCGSSDTVFSGWRYNKSRKLRIIECNGCGKYMIPNNPFPRSKTSIEIDAFILALSRGGQSSRIVANAVKEKYAYKISHNAICLKLKKYAPEIDLIVRRRNVHPLERRLRISRSVKAYFERKKASQITVKIPKNTPVETRREEWFKHWVNEPIENLFEVCLCEEPKK